MNDHLEWEYVLREAARTEKPVCLRRLFVTILIFCAPAKPRKLWDDFKVNNKHTLKPGLL